MSTRRMLNTATAAVALLLAASLAISWNQGRVGAGSGPQIDLALRQQALVQDLSRDVQDLARAEDMPEVAAARKALGRNVWQYDRNLAALVGGGTVALPDGTEVRVQKAAGSRCRAALDEAVALWLQTGPPLADLAAGEFPIYSDEGEQAVGLLDTNNILLMQHMGSLATALQEGARARKTLSTVAMWAGVVFGAALLALAGAQVASRRKRARAAAPAAADSAAAGSGHGLQAHGMTADSGQGAAAAPVAAQASTAAGGGRATSPRRPYAGPFVPPVDLGSVGASVDQISIDMDTIAASTDKVQQAVDSVGRNLQAMLDSLQDLAQDTAAGGRIVRGVNNAASFTAEAADELTASARQMSEVVGRVTQLALRTKRVAGQIEAEAAETGRTGREFTTVVAGEVRGLAQRTAEAASVIDALVADILATARRHDEAIGQIVQNVAAINQVSRNLGSLMLSPPARPVPAAGASQSRAQAAADAGPAPILDESSDQAAVATFKDETGIALAFSLDEEQPDDEAAAASRAEPRAEPMAEPMAVPMAEPKDDPRDDPRDEAKDEPDPAAAEDEPDLAAVAEQTRTLIDELAMELDGDVQPAESGSVFRLDRSKTAASAQPKPAAQPPASPATSAPAAAAAEPSAPSAADPVAPQAISATGSSANVFMLNKPKKSIFRTAPPVLDEEDADAVQPEPATQEPAAKDPGSKEPAPAGVFLLDGGA